MIKTFAALGRWRCRRGSRALRRRLPAREIRASATTPPVGRRLIVRFYRPAPGSPASR